MHNEFNYKLVFLIRSEFLTLYLRTLLPRSDKIYEKYWPFLLYRSSGHTSMLFDMQFSIQILLCRLSCKLIIVHYMKCIKIFKVRIYAVSCKSCAKTVSPVFHQRNGIYYIFSRYQGSVRIYKTGYTASRYIF